jgi:hypothetical protein
MDKSLEIGSKEPEIKIVCGQIAEAIKGLEQAIADLEGKIHGIIRIEPSGNSNNISTAVDKTPLTELGKTLNDYGSTIKSIKRTVLSLIEKIEL